MIVLALWFLLSTPLLQGSIVQLPRIDRPPAADLLTEPELGLAIREFRQRDPNDGQPVTESTAAFVWYDADNLYVRFVCRDRNPSRLRARLSKRDEIAQDDQVVVMLDTFHDRQRSYLFAVNPLGIQADALSSEGRDDDYSFDTVWRSSGRLLPDGYVVLIASPFKSLRIRPGDHRTWGMALSRIIPRNSEQSFWPHITRRVEGMTHQFATVEQPARVSGGRNLQFIPYTAMSSGRYLDPATSRFNSPTDTRAGVDAKVVIRDSVAVDAAINPDFSQVESDQPQVAVNQRFELFYPEKRPFFLESASIFRYVRAAPSDPTTRQVPDMMFFSRRIQNPQFGVRVTGKAGAWSFGSIVSDDRGFATGIEQNAAVAVGRVVREVGKQSTVGVFVTSRERAGDVNRAGALDVRLRLSPNWVLAAQAVASRTESPDREDMEGSAANVSLFYSSRRVLYSLFYSDRSPDFRAALGFVPRVDIRQIEQYGEFRWRPTTGPLTAYGPNHYVRLNWNHEGRLQEWIVRFPFEIYLKGRTRIFLRRVESFERFRDVDLRAHLQTIDVTTEWLKSLSIAGTVEWGVTPNYFPAGDVLPYLGDFFNVRLGLIYRPTPRLRQELTYLRNALRTRAGEPIFTNNIARATLNYQITRALSVRSIVDYNSVNPDVRRIRLSNDERIGLDTLVTYQLGPGTALHVGYTTGFQNLLAGEEGTPAVRTARPSTLVGRQVLVKLSYLIRR
jgi:hypothetical protein